MKQIAVISGKGGTGKTSITAALAALFPKAILVDCDVDAANMHILMEPVVREKYDFYGKKIPVIDENKCTRCSTCFRVCNFKAISAKREIDTSKCEGCGVCEAFCRFDAIEMFDCKTGEWYVSTTRFGTMVHARLIPGEKSSGKLVFKIREHAIKLASDTNTQWIIIDGPPGVGCPVISTITGTDIVLIVTEPTVSAMSDFTRAIKLVRRFNLIPMVCINRYDLNTSLTEEISNLCQSNKIPVVGRVPFDNMFVDSVVNKKCIIEAGDSPGKTTVIELYKTLTDCI